MRIIDSHCHIDVAEFEPDRNEVIAQCHALGISDMVVPAIEASSWNALIETCQQYQGLHITLGMHPVFIDQHQPEHLQQLQTMLDSTKPVAIGEIGLDYYINNPQKEKQLQLFEAQLKLASDYQLPVILHVRKAYDDVIRLLKKYSVPGGTSHAFNGSIQHAEQYRKLGFKLGFGGTMTYPNASKIHRLAKEIPLEDIVLETDAPDMTVASHRGERNSPAYIIESLSALASLKGLSEERVAEITTENSLGVFSLS